MRRCQYANIVQFFGIAALDELMLLIMELVSFYLFSNVSFVGKQWITGLVSEEAWTIDVDHQEGRDVRGSRVGTTIPQGNRHLAP